MCELKKFSAVLKTLLSTKGYEVSGIAEEFTERQHLISVSVITDELTFQIDNKTLKSIFQKFLLVTGLKFSAITKTQFYIGGKLNYRLQLKFLFL